jgi:hypothetical protein
MARVKLRKAQGKLKVEHSILDGVRPMLERLLAATPPIRSVIPGVIRRVRDARGPVKVHITVQTSNGWKAIALSEHRHVARRAGPRLHIGGAHIMKKPRSLGKSVQRIQERR